MLFPLICLQAKLRWLTNCRNSLRFDFLFFISLVLKKYTEKTTINLNVIQKKSCFIRLNIFHKMYFHFSSSDHNISARPKSGYPWGERRGWREQLSSGTRSQGGDAGDNCFRSGSETEHDWERTGRWLSRWIEFGKEYQYLGMYLEVVVLKWRHFKVIICNSITYCFRCTGRDQQLGHEADNDGKWCWRWHKFLKNEWTSFPE